MDVIKKDLILDDLKGYDIFVPLMPYIHAGDWLEKADPMPQIAARQVVAVYRYVGQINRNRYYYEFAGVMVK
jgi:hypothetical protein